MQIFTDIPSVRSFVCTRKQKNKSIGLVPTMGSLHKGHLSLIHRAKKENDVVVCSLYINPTQFNDLADFDAYPQNFKRDEYLLKTACCDILFAPQHMEMYPDGKKMLTKIDFGLLKEPMEGTHRAGHFEGVGIIIAKLFNIINPDKAYFGQKDLQQSLIIKKMVSDFFFPISVVVVPTVREKDGLAMSSRNTRLTAKQRAIAGNLYQTLLCVKTALQAEKTPEEAKNIGRNFLNANSDFQLEYIEIVDTKTLSPINRYHCDKRAAICIAAHLGKARLIDNIII